MIIKSVSHLVKHLLFTVHHEQECYEKRGILKTPVKLEQYTYVHMYKYACKEVYYRY